MGLVTHPTLAPDVSALAVYHQMHCLVSFTLFSKETRIIFFLLTTVGW
jgi:hypothetical protein